MSRPPSPFSEWTQTPVEPLEPDRCRHHRCAPCYYLHRKQVALAGYQLSEDDARFVGVGVVADPLGPGDGWRPAHFPPDTPADAPALSASDSRLLQHLMAVDVSVSMSAFLGR